jgi:hypothetical protein
VPVTDPQNGDVLGALTVGLDVTAALTSQD